MSDPRPIGLFDSGIGGLAVLREVQARLPAESTIYIGDSARHPYGTRSDAEVRTFAEELSDELVARGVKAIIIACNTATAVALEHLRQRHPSTPIIGVIRPGAAAAALATRTGRVGVLATVATVRSRAYFAAIKDENPGTRVIERAASELVPLIESGLTNTKEMRDAIHAAIDPFLAGDPGERIDTLLLGCTHFPLIRGAIDEALGAPIAVVDSAAATASFLQEIIAVNGLEAPGSSRGTAADPGHLGHTAPTSAPVVPAHQIFTTGDPAVVDALAIRLFGEAAPRTQQITLGSNLG
ncbi:glutamate racemase [bacterium]|nr:glutamate racemase [bacterium]